MCGICGYISLAQDRETLVQKMLQEINHRGPDDTGLWQHDGITLGHNRLSIIDLTTKGHQPMVRGDLVIVFNGEIYNYIELRETLRKNHHQNFYTDTDTEVILAAWEVWGEESLPKFRGMWAFAIYNIISHRLILSRDRFGIKPLYYYEDRQKFIFASEIKALLVDETVPRKACLSVISDFIVVGFQDHRPETFFQDVKQLSPGHFVSMNVKDRSYHIRKYYDLAERISGKFCNHDDFGGVLENAIRLHLRSDVPVGTCLSGGIDSSVITALAASYYRSTDGLPFQAVTAQSEDIETDESNYARIVVNELDLRWHLVRPNSDDFQQHYEHCLWNQEEPVGNPSVFMQYWVMKKASEVGLKVMLDGQGGDEALLGYERYYPMVFNHWLKKREFALLLREFVYSSRNSKLNMLQMVMYVLYFMLPRLRIMRLKHRLIDFPSELMDESFERLMDAARLYKSIPSLQISEIVCYQLAHLLKYEDRNSMIWSIEARVPFVDHELIEAALSLRPEDKIHNGYTKFILRKYMQDKLPNEIIWRKDKIGFQAPTKKWMSGNGGWVSDIFKNSVILKELGLDYKAGGLSMQAACFSLAYWEKIYHVQI